MPKGISDAKAGRKAVESPSLSTAQKKEHNIKSELIDDYNALVDALVEAKRGKYKEDMAKIKPGSRNQMAIRLYMGVAKAVAERVLMVGPEYRAEYIERTQKGIQDLLSAIRDGRTIPDPDLMTRVKKENYDKEKQIMTVSDKHGNTVDIYVGLGKAPAGAV